VTGERACAYLVSRYPSVTHTFILGEVAAMRAAGVRVETASIRRVPRDQLLSQTDHEEDARTYALLPASVPALVRAHGAALARAPGAYVKTLWRALRLAHAGGRARLWQLFYFGEAMLLWAWMERKDVRHVHVHHANVSSDVAMLATGFANAAGASRRWTWSITIHGPTELLDVAGHKLRAKIADAAAVVCTSDFARSQVASLADPSTLEKVTTVRCGIDVERFAPGTGGERDAGATLEVLCVAALSRRKGHRVLIEALRDAEGVHVTLAGDGAERAALEALVDRHGLRDRVRFLGAVAHDRVADLYRRADIFCLPSFAEGLPTVLMEAMASGLPVVATNVMGTAELVEHGVSGYVLPPARPDLVADALRELAGDAELRLRLGTAGRERVARDYEGTAAVERLRDTLAPLIAS
jgi:colanic acid/amylovoran biosynthesis glycosyltransferase